MITVGGSDSSSSSRSSSRSTGRIGSNSRNSPQWTGRIFSLLLILLQLEAQVHSQSAAAVGQDGLYSVAPVSTESGDGSASSASSSLMDRTRLIDKDSILFSSTSGQQALSEEAITHLQFLPRLLNFAERSIGDPHNQLVVLSNRHKNRSVYLGSISGSTAEFSSSYFKDKVIPPGGNTSFNVVFLPRKLGPAEGSLLIHTSFGMLRYQVQGDGIECPYRLRPLVGLQAPLNATLSPEITLYNPHDTPLQIVEIYSSGGNFQLELPSGAQEGPQALWEIPPHSTRTVIRVRFHARTPGSHVAYVRIKVSGGSAEPTLVDKMLVVPIEVEIFKETGLYSRIPFLELGLTSAEEMAAAAASVWNTATTVASGVAVPVSSGESGVSVRNSRNVTRLSLDLLNSGSQPVKVKSWGIQADDIESVLCMHVLVAEERTLQVEFDWSKLANDKRHISGRILLNLERIQTAGDPRDDDQDNEQEERNGGMDDSDALASRVDDAEDAVEGGTLVSSMYSIPFAGEVLKGSIQYNEEVLRFLLPEQEDTISDSRVVSGEGDKAGNTEAHSPGRPLVIRNHFNVPLSITNVTVPENCSRYFTLEDFQPVVLQPNDERTLLRISRRTLAASSLLTTSIFTHFRLATNISDYELPVFGYSGKLQRILSSTVRDASVLTGLPDPDGTEALDFGVLPIATVGEALVAFVNPNPVPIPIIHWKGAITSEAAVGAPTITVILRGCGPRRLDGLVFCHTVQPGEWIVYQISVQSGTIDRYQGRFTVKTDYEEIVTPLRFTTAVGELHLVRQRLRFADCFPGKQCSLSLLAASTFPNKIQIESIRTDVAGLGYEFLSPDKQRPIPANQPVILYPDAVTSIGRLTFDPKAHCAPDCYSSFDLLSKPFGVKWMATLDSYEQYRRLDSEKLLQQLQRYAEIKQRLTSVHFQVLVESSRKFDFNASVDLVWPKLLDENVFFPTLQVEQEAVKLITINNPSDQILFVHLVLHDVAVHGRTPAVDGGRDGATMLPPEVLMNCDNCSLSEESVFSFFLFDSDDIYVNYVKPMSFLRIAVKFSARLPGTYSTVLYMRNNLTLIDAAWIQARAVIPQFKFGNRRPGSPTALQFEVTDKHLRFCTDRYYSLQQRRKREEGVFEETQHGNVGNSVELDEEIDEVPAGLETKRTFTARNYGELPIVISGIRIEDLPCEGYGFKVLDCAPFELAPNASRKIEIAFTPDFTLSRVVRMLHFDTNINNFPVNFTLLGTIPMQRLENCWLSLPRPWYELWFRNLLIVVLLTAFFATLLAAILEAKRVVRLHYFNLMREKGPLQPPLDLRQIALQHTAGSTVSPVPPSVDSGGISERGKVALGNGNAGTSLVSRNNRKSERKTGTHTKGPAGGSQNGNSTPLDSNTSRFNRSWTDFTSKLAGSASGGPPSKSNANGIGGKLSTTAFSFGSNSPSTVASNSSSTSSSASEGGSRSTHGAPQKSRRSSTPHKEKNQTVPSTETVATSSSGSVGIAAPDGGGTKDRTKPSSPAEERNLESSLAKSSPVSSTSDLTGVIESNSTANHQHHHTSSSFSSSSSSSSGTEESSTGVRDDGTSASVSSSLSSSSSSSPSPTTKQQHQKQAASSAASTASSSAAKTSVKKTKSLPVNYESVVVSLASVFAATAGSSSSASAHTSQTTSALSPLAAPCTVVSSAMSPQTSTSVTIATQPSAKETAYAQQLKENISKQRNGGNYSNGTNSTAKESTAKDGKLFPSSNVGGSSTMKFQSQPSAGSSTHGTKIQDASTVGGKGSAEKLSFLVHGGEPLGKENSSSGNIIMEKSNQIELSQQVQQQQSSKKFSKTPGRERKPNQAKKGANGKGAAANPPQYKGTALQFNSPGQQQYKSTTIGTILQNASVPVAAPVSTSGGTTTVWGENCARFSDVVAQTPSSKSGSLTPASSTRLGMDLLLGLSSLVNFRNSDSSIHLRSNGGSYGDDGMNNSNAAPSGGAYRKHDSAGASTSGKPELKSKDDSQLATVSRESSAPFVVTGGSAGLGPIGTSKKSPTGTNNSDGDGGDCDGFGRAAGGPTAGVTKCWEPFGGHVIHNPGKLADSSPGDVANGTAKVNQHSDSFFSQSYADFHHLQNDHFRTIASMAGGGSNDPIASGMNTNPSHHLHHNSGGHRYSDHSNAMRNGSLNASGVMSNSFTDRFHASVAQSMRHSQQHQQQQQQQQQQHQHRVTDWNNLIDSSNWPMSSHKAPSSQSTGMEHEWGNGSDLWNNVRMPDHHYQQQQEEQHLHMQYPHIQGQLAALQPQQHIVSSDPSLGRPSRMNDGWYTVSTANTVAPPPGFANVMPAGTHANMNLRPHQHVPPSACLLQQYEFLLRQHQQQQQMRLLASDEQNLHPSTSSHPGAVGTGVSSGGPSSPTASSSPAATTFASSSSGPTTTRSSSPTVCSPASTSSSMPSYDPFQLGSIWASASNNDPWTTAAAAAASKKK